MNARCPHFNGVVRWNEVEKTWDCPVHGSRFDCEGRVLNGPASVDLGEAPEDFEAPAQIPEPITDELYDPKLA
jgi:Rieske Fe-S protein